MSFDDHHDLLEFLVDVSHQLEDLLNYQSQVIQLQPVYTSNTQPTYCIAQPVWEYHDYYSSDFYSKSVLADVPIGQVSYITQQQVPSALTSTQVVNYMQFSAKPNQSEDTGHICRYTTSLLQPETSSINMQSQMQDYHPDCAYCHWSNTQEVS